MNTYKRATVEKWVREGRIEVVYGDVKTSTTLEVRYTRNGRRVTIAIS